MYCDMYVCVCAGDIIVQIDRQELSHMTLAQATLALGTCSPLLRLAVYRPSLEDGTYIHTHTHSTTQEHTLCDNSYVYGNWTHVVLLIGHSESICTTSLLANAFPGGFFFFSLLSKWSEPT